MPAKNSLKIYIAGGFYHVYNRGVEKRNIFLNKQDYQMFLFYLKSYLLPKEKIINEIEARKDLTIEEKAQKILEVSQLRNYHDTIELFCFCLMPNHYHLLLRQKEKKDIEIFMRSLNTRYGKYFNQKYNRVGHLFQGRYKATLIDKEEYFLHLSRYIHLNPKILLDGKPLVNYRWSSYPIYINNWQVDWLKKDSLLAYFKSFKKTKENNIYSYQSFVEGYKELRREEANLYKKLMIDE